MVNHIVERYITKLLLNQRIIMPSVKDLMTKIFRFAVSKEESKESQHTLSDEKRYIEEIYKRPVVIL